MPRGKILVADAQPDVVQGVALQLSARGYQVYSAVDGLEATRTAIEQLPDLIILDSRMPAGPGHVVAERLRHIEGVCDIPQILLTDARDAAPVDRAAGSLRLRKPLEEDQLLAAVGEQMDRLAVCP